MNSTDTESGHPPQPTDAGTSTVVGPSVQRIVKSEVFVWHVAASPHSEADAATTSFKQSPTPSGSINGPLRVVSRSAPKAQRVWAARLLRAIAPAIDALSASGAHQDPYAKSPPDSAGAVPIWFVGQTKPIDAAPVLDDALKRVGYAACGRRTDPKLSVLGYRANGGSPEVEQFLALSIWGQPNQLVGVDCSLRHPPAEAFADETMLRYLPENFREVYARSSLWDRGLRFSLGKLAGWPDGRIETQKRTPQEVDQILEAAIRQFVLAKYEHVRDCASLFDLAFGNEVPFCWRQWGDTRRVAITIYLGRKLDRDPASLKSVLLSHVGKFKSPPNTSAPSAEEFVDRTLSEADAALARQ